MKKYFFPLLLSTCLLSVQTKSVVPEPPSVPVGPFSIIDQETQYVSPLGDDKEEGSKDASLFQGDIQDPGRRTGGQIGEAGTRTPWPDAIIPYVFDCSVSSLSSAMRATREAMDEWESRTCVKFVEKRPHHTVYLEFIRAAGCWATYVGYKGKKTQISIGNGCDYKHVMIHELGHVIGFWHEQSRPDRDNYITINYGNVVHSLRYNFDIVKEQVNNYGESYDFDSIMHYPFNAFAIDRRQNTIFPKDRSILNSARPYKRLSDVDVRQTRKMYKCRSVEIGRATTMKTIGEAKTKINLASTGDKCQDIHQRCKSWANDGYCDMAPDPMLTTCPQSCGLCNGPCEDDSAYRTHCVAWADYGFCIYTDRKNARQIIKFMLTKCRKSCGVCKPAPTKKPTTRPTTKLPATVEMRTSLRPATNKPKTRGGISTPTKKYTGVKCQDRSNYCNDWANDGRCDTDRWVYDNCMLSCKRFEICDQEMIKPIGTCTEALGVNSRKIIPDRNMYAPTTFVPGGGWQAPASSGRLYIQDDHAKKHVGAWCAQPNSRTDSYLQIDFGRVKRITALATQGRDVYFEHVKSYSLSFSRDESTWQVYREQGDEKVFEGNCDHVTPVLNLLERPHDARYIRIHPRKYIGAACLRVEVYGC